MRREVARKSRSEAGRVDDGEDGCEGVTGAFGVGSWALEEGAFDARAAGSFAVMLGLVAECSCSVSSRRFVASVS